MMKSTYRSPILVEYGRIDQITLGASGDKPDAIIDTSTFPPTVVIDVNNPTCTNNVPSGYCYHIT
jgi:hypothetical protein